jgi:hypothetical protein
MTQDSPNFAALDCFAGGIQTNSNLARRSLSALQSLAKRQVDALSA